MAIRLQGSPPKLQKFTVGFSVRFHYCTEGNESLALKLTLAKRDPSSMYKCILPPRDSITAGNPENNEQERT